MILSLSCSGGELTLSNDALANIIADLHISEMALARQEEIFMDSIRVMYIEKVEEIHQVDREQIKREVEALMEDKRRQSEVYKLVIDKLQAIESDIKIKNKNAPPIKH